MSDTALSGKEKFDSLGAEAGADMVAQFADVAPDLHRYITDFAFGEILARPGLSLRDRELAAIAALAAVGDAEIQLEVHMNAALNAGCTPVEVVETMLQTLLWAGFPRAVNAMRVVQRVFDARGIVLETPEGGTG